MKKWSLFLGIYFCLCLILGGCGAAQTAGKTGGSDPAGASVSGEDLSAGGTEAAEGVTETFRVVQADGGVLLLAKENGDSGDVYTLVTENLPFDSDENLTAGALAEITYDGMILETYPAQFANVTSVNILPDGFNDLCALYLDVLEDLWTVDPGLNSDGLTYIGADLSRTRLTDSEQSAVAWAFAARHSGEPVTGTLQELAEQGYFTASHVSTLAPEEGEPIPAAWYQWEDGCLFSVTETEGDVYFLPEGEEAVSFDAQKWRSGTGAYFFCDCTAFRDRDGHWVGYTVGAEAIS